MACSHATSCPLFPHLKASLAGWRSSYCDSEAGWNQCARYERSLKGDPVPLSLLPNGRVIQMLENDPAQDVPAAHDDTELTEAVPVSWWKRMFGRKAAEEKMHA